MSNTGINWDKVAMTKHKKQRLVTPRDELGEELHRAMRQAWEGKTSVIMWNLVAHVVHHDNWAWGVILDMIYGAASNAFGPADAASRLMSGNWLRRFRAIVQEKAILPGFAGYVVVALLTVIETMTLPDWETLMYMLRWDDVVDDVLLADKKDGENG